MSSQPQMTRSRPNAAAHPLNLRRAGCAKKGVLPVQYEPSPKNGQCRQSHSTQETASRPLPQIRYPCLSCETYLSFSCWRLPA